MRSSAAVEVATDVAHRHVHGLVAALTLAVFRVTASSFHAYVPACRILTLPVCNTGSSGGHWCIAWPDGHPFLTRQLLHPSVFLLRLSAITGSSCCPHGFCLCLSLSDSIRYALSLSSGFWSLYRGAALESINGPRRRRPALYDQPGTHQEALRTPVRMSLLLCHIKPEL